MAFVNLVNFKAPNNKSKSWFVPAKGADCFLLIWAKGLPEPTKANEEKVLAVALFSCVGINRMNMDYKLDYITRALSKISHKRLESFVIHRIWNALDNTDIHFVFQQYVVRKEGKYALADLYLPQINLVVEINEPAHYQNQEADNIRNAEISEYVDVKVIDCYNVVNGNAVACTLEELNQRTDMIIEFIRERISETHLIQWKGIDTPEEVRHRGYIKVEDNVSLNTIDDIAAIFGTVPKHRGFLRASGVRVPNKGKEEYVWWPNTHHANWRNELSADKLTITEYPKAESEREGHMKSYLNKDEKRITFLKYTDWLGMNTYRFVGVFQINKEKSIKENKCVWERISDTYKLTVLP